MKQPRIRERSLKLSSFAPFIRNCINTAFGSSRYKFVDISGFTDPKGPFSTVRRRSQHPSRSRDTRFRGVRVFQELTGRSLRSTRKDGTKANNGLGRERIRERREDERVGEGEEDAGCAPTCPRGIGSRGLRRARNRRPARSEATRGGMVRREKRDFLRRRWRLLPPVVAAASSLP
jgi:hypothetical protein